MQLFKFLTTSDMYDLIWSIDKEKEKIRDLIDHMQDHASNVFSDAGYPFNMKINDKSTNVTISSETKNNIYSIFKEAIHNITKHTKPESINIFIEASNNEFKMSIQNDKNVILDNRNSNRKGLASMQERTKKIGGQIDIKDIENEFTIEFKVEL